MSLSSYHTVASPLSLNITANELPICRSSYLTTATAASTYLTTASASSTHQPLLSANTHLSIANNALSVDLSSYYTKTQTGTAIANLTNKRVVSKNE